MSILCLIKMLRNGEKCTAVKGNLSLMFDLEILVASDDLSQTPYHMKLSLTLIDRSYLSVPSRLYLLKPFLSTPELAPRHLDLSILDTRLASRLKFQRGAYESARFEHNAYVF